MGERMPPRMDVIVPIPADFVRSSVGNSSPEYRPSAHPASPRVEQGGKGEGQPQTVQSGKENMEPIMAAPTRRAGTLSSTSAQYSPTITPTNTITFQPTLMLLPYGLWSS